MNITRENYEAYMLDLIEGNISSVEKAELFKFLDENSDLDVDLNDFEDAILVPANQKYNNKKSLKKDASIHIEPISEIDRLSIAYLEKDITNSELNSLEELLKSRPEKQFDFDIIQQTKLQPETKVKYNRKSKLKRSFFLQKSVLQTVYSIAAVLIILIAFSSVLNQTTVVKTSSNKIAYINNEIKYRKIKIPENKIVFQNKKESVIIEYEVVTVQEDTVRQQNQIAILDIKKIDRVLFENNSDIINLEKVKITNTYHVYNNNSSYVYNEDEISKRIRQLLDENSFENNKKTILASVVDKAKDFLKKKIQFKRTVISDNREIIAFRAGNTEYYISKSKKR